MTAESVQCPVCGEAQRDLWDYDWGTREELTASCGSCNAQYTLIRHVSVSYEARPIGPVAVVADVDQARAGGSDQRRAPVQGEGPYTLDHDDPRRAGAHYPGSVAWWEHAKAWEGYAQRFSGSARDQDAARIAQRGGFGYGELTEYLGHEPETWVINPQFADRQ